MSESIDHSTSSRNDKNTLALFFPSTDSVTEIEFFPQDRCEEVSRLLERLGRDLWSTVPRIYIVLRIIKQIDIMDEFTAKGVSDFSFPFTQKTLPEALKAPSARHRFLEVQEKVLSKSSELEKCSEGKHMHFQNSDRLPFHVHEVLGKGSYGVVHRITSKLSLKPYARKSFFRGKTFQKDHEMLKGFVNELKALKRICHPHIVQLVGSYTDPKFVAIIMSPVADEDLCSYMKKFPLDKARHSHLGGFYGCLTAALAYLHEHGIRHKDIKPQNILVKDFKPFLADFGLALDWSEKTGSTTYSTPTAFTHRYAAPEIANGLERGSSSDVWSLGCVFLEMYTVMLRKQLKELEAFQGREGCESPYFWLNTDATELWIESLRINADHPILDIIQGMLQKKRALRPNALKLMNDIRELKPTDIINFAFCGACCEEDEDSEESTYSSTDEEVVHPTIHQTGFYKPSSTIRAIENKPIRKISIRNTASTTSPNAPRSDMTENVRERKDSMILSKSTLSRPSAYHSTTSGSTSYNPRSSVNDPQRPVSIDSTPHKSPSRPFPYRPTPSDSTSYSLISGKQVPYDSGKYNTEGASNLLIKSALNPDRDNLRKALSSGIDDSLNKRYTFVTSHKIRKMVPLHWAVEGAYIDPVKLLLSKGADIEHYDASGLTALHLAARHTSSQVTSILLENGASVHSTTSIAGQTPLHTAALSGSKEIVMLLLEYGAKINALDSQSDTALFLAVRGNRAKIVEALLHHGALYDPTIWNLPNMKNLANKASSSKVKSMIEEKMDEMLLFEATQLGDTD